jgi:hypothetical protein
LPAYPKSIWFCGDAVVCNPGRPIRKRDANGYREYLPGYIDAYGGGRHKVVLIMVDMGNNKGTR